MSRPADVCVRTRFYVSEPSGRMGGYDWWTAPGYLKVFGINNLGHVTVPIFSGVVTYSTPEPKGPRGRLRPGTAAGMSFVFSRIAMSLAVTENCFGSAILMQAERSRIAFLPLKPLKSLRCESLHDSMSLRGRCVLSVATGKGLPFQRAKSFVFNSGSMHRLVMALSARLAR
jgi:hypothetical protein